MTVFNYKTSTKALLSDFLWNIIAGIALIVGPIVYPMGLRIKALKLLGPGPTTVVLIIAGIALLVPVVRELLRIRGTAEEHKQITVDGDIVTYPVIKKGRSEMATLRISEITTLDLNEGYLEVSLKDGLKVNFDVDYFDSSSQLKAFGRLLAETPSAVDPARR